MSLPLSHYYVSCLGSYYTYPRVAIQCIAPTCFQIESRCLHILKDWFLEILKSTCFLD